MSVQSYIKFWTAEPSEHEEVQAYDLPACPVLPKRSSVSREQNALSSTYIQQPKRAVPHYSSTSGKWRPAIRVT